MSAADSAAAREQTDHQQRRDDLLERMVRRVHELARETGWRTVSVARLKRALNEELDREKQS